MERRWTICGRAHREYLWEGVFRDTCGAEVARLNGSAHRPFARFEAEDGTSALVILNYEDEAVCVTARLETGNLTRYRTVDDAQWRSAAGGIAIPPRSAVLVL
jgi:hypothetical protein